MYKILLATDGSESSSRALEKVIRIAQPLNADITLISVAQVIPVYRATGYHGALFDGEQMAILERDMENAAKETLEKAKATFKENGFDVKTILGKGQPADVICRTADEGNYDVVVLGSRGLGGLRGLILGSVSSRVLNCARTAVMIVK